MLTLHDYTTTRGRSDLTIVEKTENRSVAPGTYLITNIDVCGLRVVSKFDVVISGTVFLSADDTHSERKRENVNFVKVADDSRCQSELSADDSYV